MNIKVGDYLYSVSGKRYEVAKLGRKWITTTSRYTRVHLDSLQTEQDYYGMWEQLYTTLEEVEAIRKQNSLSDYVSSAFSGLDGSFLIRKMSTDDLEVIKTIIDKYNQ